MMPFDDILIVDWSAANRRPKRPTKDAIWMATPTTAPTYHRDRQSAEQAITGWIEDALIRDQTTALGFDFGFALPLGATRRITGDDDPFSLWQWLTDRIEDAPNANNRFEIGAEMNRVFPGLGPFWGSLGPQVPDLPARGNDRSFRHTPTRRRTETLEKGTFECWQLAYAGSVGSQILMGLPVLLRLRQRFGQRLRVWPFEPQSAPVTLIEIWPSLIASAVEQASHLHPIRDAVQVSLLAKTLSSLAANDWKRLLDHPPSPEGWILGAGEACRLTATAMETL